MSVFSLQLLLQNESLYQHNSSFAALLAEKAQNIFFKKLNLNSRLKGD